MTPEKSISEILRDAGYGHRTSASCQPHEREIYRLDTGEIIGAWDAHSVLKKVLNRDT